MSRSLAAASLPTFTLPALVFPGGTDGGTVSTSNCLSGAQSDAPAIELQRHTAGPCHGRPFAC